MEKDNITWRMYGLVPYNISEIQAGIQFGHAVVEYGLGYFKTKEYKEWATSHKTFIILNGGTSSTMVDNVQSLIDNDVIHRTFVEPDLNNMLSAVVFLVDSRVYDYENYPDFYDYCRRFKGTQRALNVSEWEKDGWLEYSRNLGSEEYHDWVKHMGGEKNIFLRNYLKKFKLR